MAHQVKRVLRILVPTLVVTTACQLWPIVGQYSASVGALGHLALAVLMATAISGEINALTVLFASLGAVCGELVGAYSSIATGLPLLLGVFAERTLRIPSGQGKVMHLVLSCVCGIVLFWLGSRSFNEMVEVRFGATVLSMAMLSLAMMLSADDPVAHLLNIASKYCGENLGVALTRAVEIRRWVVTKGIGRAEEKNWREFAELVRQRANLRVVERRGVESYRGDLTTKRKMGEQQADDLDEAILSWLTNHPMYAEIC